MEKDKPKKKMGKVVTDPRFARMHTDARFQVIPQKQRKVQIDKRFEGLLTDERFRIRSAVDKRGRKVKSARNNEDLAKYYHLEDQVDDPATQDDRPPAGAAAAQDGARQGGFAETAQQLKQRRSKPEKPRAVSAKVLGPVLPRGPPEGSATVEGELQEVTNSGGRERRGDGAVLREAGPGQLLQTPGKQRRALDGAHLEAASSAEDDEEDGAGAAASLRWARARGLAGPSDSSTSDNEGAERDSDSASDITSTSEDLGGAEEGEELDPSEWGAGAMAANPAEPIPDGDDSARLAVVDLDWARVRAVDIYALLASFLAKVMAAQGQRIERVTVYPSDFGQERMAEEARLGPRGLLGPEGPPRGAAAAAPAAPQQAAGVRIGQAEGDASENGGGGISGSEGGRAGRVGAGGTGPRAALKDNGDDLGNEVDQRRLQMYERAKLRYFYAIVECADVASAVHLYQECDGLEFERTANKLDLRFVPDDQSFADRLPRDAADAVPAGYAPPAYFTTAALQQTRVKLTWDEDDAERKRALGRRAAPGDLREDDFRAYLGSESSEGEEQGRSVEAERYRRLLSGAAAGPSGAPRAGGKAWGRNAPEASEVEDVEAGEGAPRPRGGPEPGMEMQVTFGGGLDVLGERLAARRADAVHGGATVWEAYLRRRREKREAAKRMGRRAASSSDDESDGSTSPGGTGGAGMDDAFFARDAGEDPFDDPFFQDAEVDGTAAAPAATDSGNAANHEPARKGQARMGKAQRQASAADAERVAKRKEERRAAADQARRTAELELLLLDDAGLREVTKKGMANAATNGAAPGPAQPSTRRSLKERARAKRAARLRERQAGSDDEDLTRGAGSSMAGVSRTGGGFQADLADPRFAALFECADFALDPTDPRFGRAGAGGAALAAAVAVRRTTPGPTPAQAAAAVFAQPSEKKQKGTPELKFMVAALKRKAAKRAGAGELIGCRPAGAAAAPASTQAGRAQDPAMMAPKAKMRKLAGHGKEQQV